MVNWPAGTYAAVLQNAAAARSYVREFTISGAEINTDTVKTVTFPGDTSGTWPTTAVLGAYLYLTYATGSTYQTTADVWHGGNYLGTSSTTNGIGTISNVFQTGDLGLYADPDSTGVAPSFILPNYGEDLRNCQRYWSKAVGRILSGYWTSNVGYSIYNFPVEMRVAPTISASGSSLTGTADVTTLYAHFYNISTPDYMIVDAGSTYSARM